MKFQIPADDLPGPEDGFEAFRCEGCGSWLRSIDLDPELGNGHRVPGLDGPEPCGPVNDFRAMSWRRTFGLNGAEFSECGKHRLLLWRTTAFREAFPLLGVVGKNPSRAGADDDDPTVRIIHRISHDEGFGGFLLVNPASYIATSPRDLARHARGGGTIVHPKNDHWISVMMEWCPTILVAWGNLERPLHPAVRELWYRLRLNRRNPDALVCLGRTAKGHPRHPLRTKLLGLESFNPVNSYLPVNVSHQ